jgi:hypothetical protein
MIALRLVAIRSPLDLTAVIPRMTPFILDLTANILNMTWVILYLTAVILNMT